MMIEHAIRANSVGRLGECLEDWLKENEKPFDEPITPRELAEFFEYIENITGRTVRSMRTLEQTICECTRKAEANRELAKYHKSHVDRANDLKNAEECEQLAAWLRELQERRKAPEIVRCGECVNFAERDFCKVAGHNVHRKSNCIQVFGAERRSE